MFEGKKIDRLYVVCDVYFYWLHIIFSATLFNVCMSDDGRDKAQCILRPSPPHSPHPLKPNKLPKFHVHFRPPLARSGQNYFKPKLLEFTEKNGQCKNWDPTLEIRMKIYVIFIVNSTCKYFPKAVIWMC